MKAARGKLHKNARVILNSPRKDRHQWARIVADGIVCHTGQTQYIKRVAKERFNLDVNI